MLELSEVQNVSFVVETREKKVHLGFAPEMLI